MKELSWGRRRWQYWLRYPQDKAISKGAAKGSYNDHKSEREAIWRSWAFQASNMYWSLGRFVEGRIHEVILYLDGHTSSNIISTPRRCGSGHRVDTGMQACCLLLWRSLQNVRRARQQRWDLWRSQRPQSANIQCLSMRIHEGSR
jgi:hypothetical protein